MNILIVEDDLFLATQIEKAFSSYNFSHRITHIESFPDFLQMVNPISSYDTVLLDINLWSDTDKTWFDILSHIRKINEKIPIIIISSHCEYEFLEEAFAKGAHDYMIKPFRARELQIRIERWFRNYVFSEYFSINKTLEYHELTYDISAYEFYNGDKEIILSKSNKYLLSLFFIHREKLITQETLVEKIWGHSEKDYEKNLRIKIMRLKEQLKEVGVDGWIHTIRGEWYMFKKISD